MEFLRRPPRRPDRRARAAGAPAAAAAGCRARRTRITSPRPSRSCAATSDRSRRASSGRPARSTACPGKIAPPNEPGLRPVGPRRRGVGAGGPARHGRSTGRSARSSSRRRRGRSRSAGARTRHRPGSRSCRPTRVPVSSRGSLARLRGSSTCRIVAVLTSRPGSAPQASMQNSVQQLRNVHEKLGVGGSAVPDGPVLLVDDVVDSGWTLTVAGDLLRSQRAAARRSHSPWRPRAAATERHVPRPYTWPTSPTQPTGGSAHGRGSRSRARPGAVRGDRGG